MPNLSVQNRHLETESSNVHYQRSFTKDLSSTWSKGTQARAM